MGESKDLRIDLREPNNRRPMRLLWFAIGERDAPPATRVAFETPVSFLFTFLLQTFEFALVEVVDGGLVLLRLFGGWVTVVT